MRTHPLPKISQSDFENNLVSHDILRNDNHKEGTIHCNMDEKPEERGQELYSKLNSEYLIECAENERIGEWNAQYLEYLALEWNRLYPKRDWDPKNVVDLVKRDSQLIRPNFSGTDFREAISRGVCFKDAHIEGALLSGAHLEGADLRVTYFEGADFFEAHLERAHLNGAHLNGAEFIGGHLEEANFEGAHFKDTEFLWAHLNGAEFMLTRLEGANFEGATLEGAEFLWAHLEGADFTYAIVNGETLFVTRFIDKNTDFTGTALSATRIDPILRTRLERNIREMQWRKWYDKQKFSPWEFLKKSFGKKEETEKKQECKSSLFDRLLINPFVKLFWWLSDYGTSCKRCLVSFGGLIVLAFIVNLVLTQHLSPDIAELFANTVLALFGVGDPGLEGIARLWQVVYVISGYFLLAVLISRFAIMFQNMSP